MNIDNQIMEMAKVLCEDCARDTSPCVLTKTGRMCDSVKEQAEALYNAGYRKQSEGIANNATTTAEWISVDDRLPDEEGDYLCLIVDYLGETRMEVHKLVKWANCSNWIANMSSFWEKHNTITHWMPLPEAPKGGEE